MKITDVTLSILRTELAETVIPTNGAVDAMPQRVLVTVPPLKGSTEITASVRLRVSRFVKCPKCRRRANIAAAVVQRDITRPATLLVRTSTLASVCPTIQLCGQSISCAESWE